MVKELKPKIGDTIKYRKRIQYRVGLFKTESTIIITIGEITKIVESQGYLYRGKKRISELEYHTRQDNGILVNNILEIVK